MTEHGVYLDSNNVDLCLGSKIDNNIWFQIGKEEFISFNGEKFKEEDFKLLKVILNERRGNMYSLYRVYLVDRETLNFYVELVIAKTEISAVNTALKQSMFQDRKLDDLHYKFEVVTTFEKKKKLKDAVDEIKKALE